jgi:hypothetical protein
MLVFFIKKNIVQNHGNHITKTHENAQKRTKTHENARDFLLVATNAKVLPGKFSGRLSIRLSNVKK